MDGRCRHDERQRDNQPVEKNKRGCWQRKQQQLQLRNNQQIRYGAKARTLSQREGHRFHNGGGGSNDDNNAEMTTTKTTAAASVGSNVGTDAAAPLCQGLTKRGKHSRCQSQCQHHCHVTTASRCHGHNGRDIVVMAVGRRD